MTRTRWLAARSLAALALLAAAPGAAGDEVIARVPVDRPATVLVVRTADGALEVRLRFEPVGARPTPDPGPPPIVPPVAPPGPGPPGPLPPIVPAPSPQSLPDLLREHLAPIDGPTRPEVLRLLIDAASRAAPLYRDGRFRDGTEAATWIANEALLGLGPDGRRWRDPILRAVGVLHAHALHPDRMPGWIEAFKSALESIE